MRQILEGGESWYTVEKDENDNDQDIPPDDFEVMTVVLLRLAGLTFTVVLHVPYLLNKNISNQSTSITSYN
jgi:hypothetical protein